MQCKCSCNMRITLRWSGESGVEWYTALSIVVHSMCPSGRHLLVSPARRGNNCLNCNYFLPLVHTMESLTYALTFPYTASSETLSYWLRLQTGLLDHREPSYTWPLFVCISPSLFLSLLRGTLYKSGEIRLTYLEYESPSVWPFSLVSVTCRFPPTMNPYAH